VNSGWTDSYDASVGTSFASPLVAATAGKSVINTPETLARAELAYDDGSLYGTVAAAFTGERFSSYLNDESAGSYTLFELTGGYRFIDRGNWLDGTEVQFNVTNLFDEDHISTVGSGGFQNGAGRQTFLPGAPRQAFVTLRRSF
jgi:iron complex outermembrane receptor protein